MGAPIAPFGDAPADSFVLNRKLSDLQRETLAACGIAEVSPLAWQAGLPLPRASEPYLLLSDDLFVSRTLLREFLAAATAPGATGVKQLALPDCRLLKDTAPMQDLERGERDGKAFTAFPAWVVHPGAPEKLDAATSTPVVIDPREELRAIENVPKVFAEEGKLDFVVTARVAMRLQHWVHVLRANQIAMIASLAELKERPWVVNALSVLWLLVKAFPPNEPRVLRAAVRKGKGVKIHPSAVVEACVLGDGVQIGAQSFVRGAILGKGVVVAEQAQVEMSVLGDNARVTKGGTCNFNVLYPGAVLGQTIAQMSLLGREAFVAALTTLYDFRFDGEINVEHRGQIVSAGARFLGIAVGHGTRVGAGVAVAHGRAIPNGVTLLVDPERIVSKFEGAAPGTTLAVSAGGLAAPLARRKG